MRMYEILEMALKNTRLVGDFDSDSSFTGADRKIHLGKNRVRQLKDFFQKTNVDFSIVFMNSKFKGNGEHFDNKDGFIDLLKYRGRLSDYDITSILDSMEDDTINILLTNNDGNNKVPLSPWIVAHRISHILATDYSEYDDAYRSIFLPTMAELTNAVFTNNKNAHELEIDSDSPFYWSHIAAQVFGTMTSAKTKKIVVGGGGEFFHELFAQYINDGHITLNKSGFTDVDDAIFSLSVKPDIDISIITKAEKTLSAIFEKSLAEAKGHYYVL
jgi:hypothetical protein